MNIIQVLVLCSTFSLCLSVKLECAVKNYDLCSVESFEALKTDVLEFDNINPHIKKIYFKQCKFPVFPSQVFNHFLELKQFTMRNNGLKQLNSKMFLNASKLDILSFDNNSIVALKNKVFVHLKGLRLIDVIQNKLKFIAVNAFQVN